MTNGICIMCKQDVVDVLQFGEKITFEDVTAHHFCLLLSGNLKQSGKEGEGILRYMPADIKKEAKRASKRDYDCTYCKKSGGNISCCDKKCKKTFHLPCALKKDCRFEFIKRHQSFCDAHHGIKRSKNAHKPTDLCTICSDEMGEFNPIRSIPLACCNENEWCHKLCLQQYAQTSGYFLKCPLCKDEDKFRNWIAEHGVFIPNRDAKWEFDNGEPNSFYDFQEHTKRPSKCEATICECEKGRNYHDPQDDNYSLENCQYCGSHAAHRCCLNGKEEFLCDECTTSEKQLRQNFANTTAHSDQEANQQYSSVTDGGSMTETESIVDGSSLHNSNHMEISIENESRRYKRSRNHSKSINIVTSLEPNDSENDLTITSFDEPSGVQSDCSSNTEEHSMNVSDIELEPPRKKQKIEIEDMNNNKMEGLVLNFDINLKAESISVLPSRAKKKMNIC